MNFIPSHLLWFLSSIGWYNLAKHVGRSLSWSFGLLDPEELKIMVHRYLWKCFTYICFQKFKTFIFNWNCFWFLRYFLKLNIWFWSFWKWPQTKVGCDRSLSYFNCRVLGWLGPLSKWFKKIYLSYFYGCLIYLYFFFWWDKRRNNHFII